MESRYIIIIVLIIALIAVIILSLFDKRYNLNKIKSKTVGDGQHGTARWATNNEVKKNFTTLEYTPALWRKGENLPSKKEQGTIIGCATVGNKTYALLDTDDVHTLMIAAAGVGKTTYFLQPNIEYCCAAGMSFINTDTKGDIYRTSGYIAKEYYGYDIAVIDLRNPIASDGNNILYLVSKYMQEYKADPTNTRARAKAEKYAKITAENIITTEGKDFGANSYFYDSAKGLLSAMILILAEYGEPEECHIVSVLKLMIEFLETVPKGESSEGKTYFSKLMEKLPPDHRAKWLAGSALNSSDQTTLSSVTTAISKLNAFIDTELEQVLCFDTAIDAEKFSRGKCGVFVVLPEEDRTKYVIANLIIQQLSRELYAIADEYGGKLPNRVMFYLDEFGTLPRIDGAEMMFSASRSRMISIVAIIQSMAQLRKNYDREGAEIIADNTQLTLFGGFAPGSSTPEDLSKKLGSQTVMSGSVTQGGGTGATPQRQSQSLQMIGRPLISPDELRNMRRGNFICLKTGMDPMKVKLKLYKEWGITFDEQLSLRERELRNVSYAEKKKLLTAITGTDENEESEETDMTEKKTEKSKEEIERQLKEYRSETYNFNPYAAVQDVFGEGLQSITTLKV